MCHIGSAAVTYLTSMTGGARPKIARRPSPGRYCTWSRPRAGAVAWRDVRRSHQGFIYRVLFSNFNPPSRGIAVVVVVVVIVSAKNSYLRQKSRVVVVRLYCVLPTDCSAASLVWPPRRLRVAAQLNREPGGEMKKRKTQANKKESQHIIHFKSQKLPAVRGWTFY